LAENRIENRMDAKLRGNRGSNVHEYIYMHKSKYTFAPTAAMDTRPLSHSVPCLCWNIILLLGTRWIQSLSVARRDNYWCARGNYCCDNDSVLGHDSVGKHWLSIPSSIVLANVCDL
jgi:hypothetical protein